MASTRATAPVTPPCLALAGKQALLVLDGTEAADDLDAVLSVAGSCGVLITTRRHEDAPGERQDIEPLPRAESLQLLRAWAGKYAADGPCRQRDRAAARRAAAGAVPGRPLPGAEETAGERVAAWLQEQGLAALHFGERPQQEHPAAAAAQPGRR